MIKYRIVETESDMFRIQYRSELDVTGDWYFVNGDFYSSLATAKKQLKIQQKLDLNHIVRKVVYE